ncbi:DUF3950 domain-containing protein [Yersinia wautersii]|uniref:DUF3950 domain-containing protein n=1 Tax=Yersinia pseudotuberculosis TaxID=633 RepID=UPI0008FFBF54|nr:DUF3950 domain-containing protein [Yersinia pseudotuberculosis]
MQERNSKNKTDRSGSTRKIIRFEDELLEQIENAADKGQFSSWVKDSCRQRLEREGIEPKG